MSVSPRGSGVAGERPSAPVLSREERLEQAIEEIHVNLSVALMYDGLPDMARIKMAAIWAREAYESR